MPLRKPPPWPTTVIGQDVAFCDAANLEDRTLLTGNGVSPGFSVLVRWHTSFGAGYSRSAKNYVGGNMKRLILAAASTAALALVGPASAQSPIVIKLSHVVAPNTPKGLASEKFKELAEKYSGGNV